MLTLKQTIRILKYLFQFEFNYNFPLGNVCGGKSWLFTLICEISAEGLQYILGGCITKKSWKFQVSKWKTTGVVRVYKILQPNCFSTDLNVNNSKTNRVIPVKLSELSIMKICNFNSTKVMAVYKTLQHIWCMS